MATERCRPDWSFGAIRGQTEYFRATAARKYLVSPRIADCAPGLAAGFDSFSFQTEHFRANAARKCLVSPRIAAWADSETPPPGFAVPRHSTSSRSNFFTPSCPRFCHRLLHLLLPRFPGEVIEHPQLVAVQVGDSEFAQAPRFILRLSQNLRPSLPPATVQFIDILPAIQIQPDHNRPAAAVVPAKRSIREEHTAIPLRDAADPALVVTPIEMKPEHIHVIFGGLLDIANRNLRNRLGKMREHVLQITSLRHKNNGEKFGRAKRLPHRAGASALPTRVGRRIHLPSFGELTDSLRSRLPTTRRPASRTARPHCRRKCSAHARSSPADTC